MLRVTLYLLAFVVMTLFPSLQTLETLVKQRQWRYSPLAYEIAKKGVEKRNEVTQRKILAPYQLPPEQGDTSSEADATLRLPVYNLALLWDRRSAGRKPLIVNIPGQEIQRYFIVKLSALLSEPGVKAEIESPVNSAQIQDMLVSTIAAQKVEEVQLPEGKAKFKEEIRTQLNEILGGNKIVAIYLSEFNFQ